MAAKQAKRIIRTSTANDRARHAEIRKKAMKDFPPLVPAREPSVRNRIAAQIRKARQAQGLTWYAVAKKAGIPNPNTVRDIEYGSDAKLSNVQAVAQALGLKLELVDAV